MNLVIDIAVVAILAIGLLLGLKRGLARSLLSFAAYAASLAGAAFGGGILAGWLYDAFFRQMLTDKISEILTGAASLTLQAQAQAVLEQLPGFLSAWLQGNGVTAQSIAGVLQSSSDTAAPMLAELAAPFVVGASRAVLALVLFAVLMVATGVLVRMASSVFKLPLLRQADSILGGLFGLLSGGIVAVFCCVLLQIIAPLGEEGFLGIRQEDVESSYACRLVDRYNPVKTLFSQEP